MVVSMGSAMQYVSGRAAHELTAWCPRRSSSTKLLHFVNNAWLRRPCFSSSGSAVFVLPLPPSSRGFYSFPFPLNMSLLSPTPLN